MLLLTAVAVIGGTYHAAAPMQVKQCALRILSRDTLLANTSSKTESFTCNLPFYYVCTYNKSALPFYNTTPFYYVCTYSGPGGYVECKVPQLELLPRLGCT